MFGLSMSEILIVGVLALIVIGPRQLPELARTIGRMMSELRKATDHITEQIRAQATIEEDKRRLEDGTSAAEEPEVVEYYTPPPTETPDPEGAVTYDPESARAREYALQDEPEQLSFAGSETEDEDPGERKGS